MRALLALAGATLALAGQALAGQALAVPGEGDPARGAEAFRQICSACHTVEAGARRRVGPNLFGVAGGRPAAKEGYPYSEAFRQADHVWDDETLARFLAGPGQVVPGTKMDWAVRDPGQVRDLVAYLKQFR